MTEFLTCSISTVSYFRYPLHPCPVLWLKKHGNESLDSICRLPTWPLLRPEQLGVCRRGVSILLCSVIVALADAVAKRYRPWPKGLRADSLPWFDSPLVQGASRLRYTDKAQMQRPGHTGRKALATKKSSVIVALWSFPLSKFSVPSYLLCATFQINRVTARVI